MKVVRTLFAAFFFAAWHASALAYGGLWLDTGAELRAMKKLVLFPMSVSDDLNAFATDGDESSAVFRQNDYLHRRLAKKLKDANLLRLAPDIAEQRIRETIAPFASLLAPVPDASVRAAEIRRLTMADGYIVPHFRENWVRIDISPETTFHFTLREWTERRDESGTRVTRDYSYPVVHVIPEREMELRIMDVDYTLFDAQGRAVLSFENSDRAYFADALDMYKDLAEEFADTVKDARKGKFRMKTPGENAVSVALSGVLLPEKMTGDAVKERAIRFAFYEEARRREQLRLDSGTPRLLVEADIRRCELVPTWHPPAAWVTTSSTTHDESWTDKQGKRHEVKRIDYTQSVSHSFGYYSYHAEAEGDLRLVDAATGTVLLRRSFAESDDKTMDACRHAFRSFFKDVEKYVKKNMTV
ncbi:MAG: hypothetical protein J5477_07235 [Schwartzia sp.]|nr:hypothetical protein [Schwartzia sp. (in: firmicutes)]